MSGVIIEESFRHNSLCRTRGGEVVHRADEDCPAVARAKKVHPWSLAAGRSQREIVQAAPWLKWCKNCFPVPTAPEQEGPR